MRKDFISIHDLSLYEFTKLMDLAKEVKAKPDRFHKKLKGKILAMIFQKPSLRTRMTFEVGMLQLGGEAIYLAPSDIQLGSREGVYDVGKNLERWVDGIMIRAFAHQNVIDLAASCRIPVINGLTDLLHPCQALADFQTLYEKNRNLKSFKLTYVGDGNNVCHSLMFAAAKAGATMAVATPPGYEPNPEIVKLAAEDGRETGYALTLTHDPPGGREGETGEALRTLAGQRSLDGAGQTRGLLHALPPRPPGGGGQRRSPRFAAFDRL
jgi:ornithine carbamoyltransferase